jgi:hypothetical protein
MSSNLKNITAHTARSLLSRKTARSLKEVRDALADSGARLEGKLHSRVGWLVNDTLKRLEQHTARIAFVGQVKAGKSSVVNAFMKRPDFLPTDVNPSTAVITKIYFDSAKQPANTALFHFFTEHEWDELFSKRDKHDPNYSALMSLPASRRSLESLRQRAQVRLGPGYEQLLGKHHLFSAVTPRIVEQYVSAGDFSNKSKSMQDKYFSDVTRMAEVFLDANPVFYPSVLIDTPGVNDLFFVREEITRANLADADVYVLVLTAQQPLSRGDLSLLRLLRGLKRDKVIAVINRIDILTDIYGEGERLRQSVQADLKRELPYANIPVVLTSALWANAALRESPFATEGLITRQFIDYAHNCGVGNLLRRSAGADPDEVLEQHTQALYACSGMEDLEDCINRLIATSIVEEQLLPASSALAATAHNTALAARYGLKSLVSLEGGKQNLEAASLEHLKRLETYVSQIERLMASMQNEWALFASSEVSNIERYLMYAVERFAEAQAFLYAETDTNRPSNLLNWSENTLNFRIELADLISRSYNDISRLLFEKQQEAEAKIRYITGSILPEIDGLMKFGMRPSKSGPAYLMPLSKATVFEMDDFWQHEMSTFNETFEKKAREIKAVIITEFHPIIKDMNEAAKRNLDFIINDITRHLNSFVFSSLYPIVQQLEAIISQCKSKPTAQDKDEFTRKLVANTKEDIDFLEKENDKINLLKKSMYAM